MASLSAQEEVCIVDENNNEIGKADRAVMRFYNLPHRASYIIIKNHKDQFYVQRRTMIKDYCPGYLDPTTGGVVQAGEPVELNAKRETEEEMGIKDVDFKYIDSFYYSDDRSHVWGGIFEVTYEGPLVLQEEEVAEVLMMTKDEILSRRSDFTPDGLAAFEHYLQKSQQQ